MTFREALAAMLWGALVTRPSWDGTVAFYRHPYVHKDGTLIHGGFYQRAPWSTVWMWPIAHDNEDLTATDYEVAGQLEYPLTEM